MSIFKDTLSPFVQNQLEARKQVVSQWGSTGLVDDKGNTIYNAGAVSRKSDFLRFTTGKNAWVKMQSFVDFNGKIGSATYAKDQLARKYVLEGGTLFEEKTKDKDGKLVGTNKFTLRYGVGRRDSVYASDLDEGGDRPLGYRPMPGITSIQINNKSAYGSLREATVKFYAWDKHQLEELELIYMRPGFTILLEWGWSQYLNSKDLNDVKIENFLNKTIDAFQDNNILNPKGITSDEAIYGKIRTLNEDTYGNYDAMLGYVKNFSWQLMPNGGFECTTVLISRGEIISTLKLNSNGPEFTENVVQEAPPLSLFENLMLNYSALINEGELTDASIPNQPGQFNTGSSSVQQQTKNDLLNDINTRLGNVALYDFNGSNYSPDFKSKISSKNYGKILITDGNVDGVGIEYIQMNDFIALLNLYFNFKDINNKTISQIIIPRNTPCLAGVDSISIDPTTCIIYNSLATYITGNSDGFFPKTLSSYNSISDFRSDSSSDVPQFLTNGKLGIIGNIFLSIPKLLEIFRSKGGATSDITVIDFLKEVLNQTSKALGGINDFQLHTTKSTVQIIDIKYLERGQGKNKYILDLMGLKSICRDVKINSRIFESQSSMIAIAAQNRSNVGDIYSSTQSYLNKGLRDRILADKIIYNDGNQTSKELTDRIKSSFSNVLSLRNYIIGKCMGLPNTNNTSIYSILYPSSEEISNAASLQKSILLQTNGSELDFKALIPFELEITLDGIAGLVQGQIFKVDTSILPARYHQSNVGFIITGIAHSLQNNDWITTIKTQVCLLDNESIPRPKLDKNALGGKSLEIQRKVEEQRKVNIILWNAVADYMVQILANFYDIIGNKKYNYKGGGYFTDGTQIPIKETTPRLAVEAYRVAGAGVVIPYWKQIGEGEDRAVRFFTAPYVDYNYTYGVESIYDKGVDKSWYSGLDEQYGGPADKINKGKRGKEFGYLITPFIDDWVKDIWAPNAMEKFKPGGEWEDADLYKQAELMKTEGVNNSIKKVIEFQTNVTYTNGVPSLNKIIDKFISHPNRFDGFQVGYGNAQDDITMKDNFVLRSKEYVKYAREKTVSWRYGYPSGEQWYPDLWAFNDLFTEQKDEKGNTFYTYKERKTNKDFFLICFKYIVTSGYFNDLDVTYRPSLDIMGDPKKFFSVFHGRF